MCISSTTIRLNSCPNTDSP
uniref:Uncharacterized protein n=1 Tax=Arundo donax TaxID=35708 RepID=A0A0A8ZTN6_ARUDO